MREQHDYDIVILQEAGNWGDTCYMEVSDGDLFMLTPKEEGGHKQLGCLIRSRARSYCCENTFVPWYRAAAISLKLRDRKVWLVSGHLSPYHSIGQYEESMESLEELLAMAPAGCDIFLGVDV